MKRRRENNSDCKQSEKEKTTPIEIEARKGELLSLQTKRERENNSHRERREEGRATPIANKGGREMEAHNLSKERRGKQILLKATREKREKTFL